MRYNKTLGVAVAAILSGGIGFASAGELYFGDKVVAGVGNLPTFGADVQITPANKESNKIVASESVDSDGAINDIVNSITVFEFQRDTPMEYGVYVRYTLIGAEFAAATNPTFVNKTPANASLAPITRIEGGQLGDTTAMYLFKGSETPVNNDITVNSVLSGTAFDADEDFVQFIFTPQKLIGLVGGGTVQLKVEWGAASNTFSVDGSVTKVLYQSKPGVEVVFSAKDPASKIDVTEGSKKFIDGYSATAITIGTVFIKDDATYPITTAPNDNEVTGELIVTGGPFSASTGANQVFLDADNTAGSCVFTPDTNDVAGVVKDDLVTFKLEVNHIDAIADKPVDVCVVVDEANETDINNTKDRATGILTLTYDTNEDKTYVGRLAQTKRNGTTCTLYNVPHNGGDATDTGYYRFINKTDKDVTVWGTLKDRDAKEYFADQELGTAAANSTLVVTSDALHDFAVAGGADEEKPWIGRAILTINSNSTDMEAYALLRGKNTRSILLPANALAAPAVIGPLVNVSLGASGNGCD